MKLQHKAWVLILLIVALGALGVMFGARYQVLASFEDLELKRALTEGERARRVLDQEVKALLATSRDYTYWNDTADFVTGAKTGFMEDNFDLENLGYLRISEVLVFDAAGKTVSTVTVSAEEELVEVAPERIGPLRDLVMPLLQAGKVKNVLSTKRMSDGHLEIVVGALIHRTDVQEAKAEGAIVMVRRVGEKELQTLSDVMMLPVQLEPLHPGHEGKDAHLESVDQNHQRLHTALTDQQGQPVVELVLSLDRPLNQQAGKLAWTGMAMVGLGGSLACVMLVFLLDRLLLRRLQNLHDDLELVIDGDLNGGQRVRAPGQDELGNLARGINQLLERVRRDAIAQREAHAQQEVLQMQLLQSQKIEALGRFTGGIAHDFNNSLAAITGWMKVAVEDLDPAHPSQESLQHALKATRYADGLMRQLLAYSRQSTPRMERLRVSRLIEDTKNLVASGLVRRSEIEVRLLTEDDWVQADPTQMQQVLVNLLMNASDAMEGEGVIHLELDAFALKAGQPLPGHPETAGLPTGDYVCLTVRDEGPGIPPEHLHRIFDPFFTTKKVGRGTGLGLSVAHGIMARHNGAIGVSSEMGQGACLRLYLPASKGAEAPVEAPPPALQQAARRVLFVDDDPLVRHAWSRLLERKGWLVTRARDGEEGWELFKQSLAPWDVVLTDLTMPKLDGRGLAKRIRATPKPPPVVLMSGNVRPEDKADWLQTDFAAVLHKPVDANELETVLRSVTGDQASGPV